MKNKRVAIVVKYFPTVSETFIVNQINSLMTNGYRITLLAYHKVEGIPIHRSLQDYNLLNEVHYFKPPPKSKIKRLFTFFQWVVAHVFNINWSYLFKSVNVFKHGKDAYTLKLFYESQWFILKHDFDIIHAHFGMNGNRIAYLKGKGILPEKISLVTTFHGYDMMPNQIDSYKTTYKYLFNEANAFTVNTPYLETLTRQANPNKTPVYILPVGLDTNYFKRTLLKKETHYFDIVFCGRLISLKGPEQAVLILKALHVRGFVNTRLHIIGEGKLKLKLKQLVADLNLQEFVFMFGSLTQDDIKKKLELSDVLIMPGIYDKKNKRAETQGLVIQEAQAMSLPVVVSDAGGMKYGLIDGETGYVVKAGDVEGFAGAIEKLLLDNDLKLRMGKKGRQFVEQYYDNKVLVKQLEAIYESIL